jgi:hypothetical protein
VVAYLVGTVAHYNIEIGMAHFEGEDGALEFPWSKEFLIGWDMKRQKWKKGPCTEHALLNPQIMWAVTPYNFMYVFWNEFESIVEDVLDVWNGVDKDSSWGEMSRLVYWVANTRVAFLKQPWMRSRSFRWKGWKSENCYGLALSKYQREKIERGQMPQDYLQATVSNHKREHLECPANGFEETGDPGRRWNLTDIFECSPETYMYPLPTTEEESERMQGRGKETKEGGKKRKEGREFE